MPLSMIEYQIMTMIPRGAANPITVGDLKRLTQIDKRAIREIISDLIRLHGVPIVAMRYGKRGMFIATNDDERSIGIASYKSQIASMQGRASAIESADLNGWELALRPEIKRLTGKLKQEVGNHDTAS
ncbi:DNA replication protein [Lactiplantibacillus songbeiensis]|uniref:DNA replication protein n=1 Tax=Lactiplantibacillus songbeiensis TaxID=2559920 RepID=A0ABW4BWN8_9LACO|nr:DNA replication protein [Lactiplantibacillus songbeiensis]